MRTFIVAHESYAGHPPGFKQEELKMVKAGSIAELLFRITGWIEFFGMSDIKMWKEWHVMNGNGGPFYFFKELVIEHGEPRLRNIYMIGG